MKMPNLKQAAVVTAGFIPMMFASCSKNEKTEPVSQIRTFESAKMSFYVPRGSVQEFRLTDDASTAAYSMRSTGFEDPGTFSANANDISDASTFSRDPSDKLAFIVKNSNLQNAQVRENKVGAVGTAKRISEMKFIFDDTTSMLKTLNAVDKVQRVKTLVDGATKKTYGVTIY